VLGTDPSRAAKGVDHFISDRSQLGLIRGFTLYQRLHGLRRLADIIRGQQYAQALA
jgi:hypothetical protein